MRKALAVWQEEGEAPEADWAAYLWRLADRGALGGATSKLLLDLPALAQPYACASALCTPGRRASRARSCCADLEVTLTENERSRLLRRFDRVRAHMVAHDPRWAADPARPVFEGDALLRPGRRCVFAIERRDGLRCGLHEIEEQHGLGHAALKPIACQLFPLVLVSLGDGRSFLTALTPVVARMTGSRPSRAFPCLGDPERPPLAETMYGTLEHLFGARAAAAILDRTRAWRAGPELSRTGPNAS
jgi:hypothetical protein